MTFLDGASLLQEIGDRLIREFAEAMQNPDVARKPAHRDRLFSERPGRRTILWMSLSIVIFLICLVYALKHFPGPAVVDQETSALNCTLFASASGNDADSGMSPSASKTFSGAAVATQPGSVVCLLGGTYNLSSSFYPPKSGTDSSWIVYKNYDSTPVNFVWTGPADASPMFKLGTGKFPAGPAYLEFLGLHLDGRGNAADGFFCRGGHHLRFIANLIANTGGSGIGSINCDYLTADHNTIDHNGYIPSSTKVPQWYSWTSGISLNSNQWFDRYRGFHNIISNNIVAGQVDQSEKHSDGNGIILDLSNGSYAYSSADTPPALIVNNVVYGNGGRCIEAYTVTNFWIVNNTCYKNDLDSSLKNAGSLTTSNSHDGYFVNNIAVAADSTHPPYDQENSNARILYYSDMYFGASNNFTYSDPSQLIQADPQFLEPPVVDPALPEPFATIQPASRIGVQLTLRTSSPAIGRGTDPTALPNLPPAIVSGLMKYIYVDIGGNARSRKEHFDLGAYQSLHVR